MNTTHRLITTRLEFQDALHEAFADMARTGCREAWLSDEDFAGWPLNAPAVIEHLTQWAQAHRKLTVVARHFDELVRRHPRWVQWRRTWSHIVACRTAEDADAGDVPTMLLAPGLVVVRLFDADHVRGSVSRDPADALRGRELVDAVLQRSSEFFPSTIFGL
jgi:hypothetical protein